MVSRWFLGAVSAAGLAAGFSVSAYAGSAPKGHSSGYAEVERLYRTELTLGNREQELQFLLKLRGEQIAATPRPAVAATPQPAAAAIRPPAIPTTPAAAQPSQRITPATTTTVAESPPPPEPEPTPTTVTLPPTTTTTTLAPTTTTTTWRDDPGGVDN